jgi:hypothetical protein
METRHMKRRLPFFRETLFNNWIYKAVAFVVAFAIWATTIYGQKDTILTRVMELEYVVRPNFAVMGVNDRLVQVEVEGPRQMLNKFIQGTNTVTLNLSNETEGEKRVAIRPSDIALPHGLRLRSISPNEILVKIEEVKKQ